MTSTAQWLHFKLGVPPGQQEDGDAASGSEIQTAEADLIAQQQAMAAMPLRVTFPVQ